MKEVKLVLLGAGGVGKTSIAASLVENLKQRKLVNSPSTKGIQIRSWKIDNKKNDEEFKVNIWDFGGQEIYHSTHQFFLTKRTIYLIVTDSRSNDSEDDIYYWLNMIKVKVGNCPVILVMNKIDERYKDLPVDLFKSYFNNVVGLCKVSCLPEFEDTIDSLKAEIRRVLFGKKGLLKVTQIVPKKWEVIKSEIEKLNLKERKVLLNTEFNDICGLFGIEDLNLIQQLSEYMHDSGYFLHYSNDLELRRKIFLDYDWLLSSIYRVLDDRIIVKNKGVFYDTDLMRIWSEDEYQTVQPELLSLMKLFELCFEVNRGEYLAPQLLPVKAPNFEWEDNISELQFEIKYRFMPKGIMSRLIVKRNRDVFQRKYWRYGVVLEYEETKALVKEYYLENKIIIRVIGEQKRELLSVIRKSIQEIHQTFQDIEVEEWVPCTCSVCTSNKNPYFYSYESLIKRIRYGRKTIECDHSYEDVPIHSILEGVNLPSDEEILNALDSISIRKLLDK